jgi:hypothetical protein
VNSGNRLSTPTARFSIPREKSSEKLLQTSHPTEHDNMMEENAEITKSKQRTDHGKL